MENLSDQCPFTFRDVKGEFVYLGVHVDDRLIVLSSDKLQTWIVAQLEAEFKMHMLGDMQVILGTEVEYADNGSIRLHQG